MIYVAMISLVLMYMVVTYFFPLTVASYTSMVYLCKIGIAGHCISLYSSDGKAEFLPIAFVILAFIIDIALWATKRIDKKPQENKVL